MEQCNSHTPTLDLGCGVFLMWGHSSGGLCGAWAALDPTQAGPPRQREGLGVQGFLCWGLPSSKVSLQRLPRCLSAESRGVLYLLARRPGIRPPEEEALPLRGYSPPPTASPQETELFCHRTTQILPQAQAGTYDGFWAPTPLGTLGLDFPSFFGGHSSPQRVGAVGRAFPQSLMCT